MKVFGIGLNKTGTKTLGACLRHFNHQHLTYDLADLRAFKQGRIDYLLEKIQLFDSSEDWPWPLLFDILEKNFPAAKFILTLRQTPAIWFDSLCRHADKTGPTEARRLVYGYEMPHDYRQHHLDFYNHHHQKVMSYFKDKPDKLLVVCWENGDDWRVLCQFLGYPVPAIPFPHLNRSLIINPQPGEQSPG